MHRRMGWRNVLAPLLFTVGIGAVFIVGWKIALASFVLLIVAVIAWDVVYRGRTARSEDKDARAPSGRGVGGLASQAQQLTYEQQSLLGLLVAWMFSPLLDVDRSAHGRQRRDACLAALDEALIRFDDAGAMKQLRKRVKDSPELVRDLHNRRHPLLDSAATRRVLAETSVPPGERHRLDFMAMLDYAIQTLTKRSSKPMASCLQRAEHTIDREKRHGRIPEYWDVDGALLEIVAGPQLTSARGAESFPALQQVLRPAFEALAAELGSQENLRRLASEAQRLPYERQALLGLLVMWVLSPLLDVDRSEYGRSRRDVCLGTLNEALTQFHGVREMARLEERVNHSEELDLEEEPDELPVLYRYQIVVMLLNAIQAVSECSWRPMASFFQRAEETIDLGKRHGTIPESWYVDGALLDIVAGPQLTSARGAESIPALQQELRPAFEALAAAVESR